MWTRLEVKTIPWSPAMGQEKVARDRWGGEGRRGGGSGAGTGGPKEQDRTKDHVDDNNGNTHPTMMVSDSG